MSQQKHHMRPANERRDAELGVKNILAKLKADSYKNSAYEDADRKMLEVYLARLAQDV